MYISEAEKRVFSEWELDGINTLLLLKKTHNKIEGPSTETLVDWPSITKPIHRKFTLTREDSCRGYLAYSKSPSGSTLIYNSPHVSCPFSRIGFSSHTHPYPVTIPLCGQAGETTSLFREVTCEKCLLLDME